MSESTYDPPESPRSVGWTEARRVELVPRDQPLSLELGGSLGPGEVEYESYGTLAPNKDNVVLIAHALTGDAHVAGWDRNAERDGRTWRMRKPGWWDTVVGPGKAIDTNRFFVVCSNVLGSCYGSSGPLSTDPATGAAYGLDFPIVTIGDWVRVQARLLDHLGVERLHAVVGGSLGGQQAMEWALAFPERVDKVAILAASPKLSTQGLAFNAVGRHAILTDRNFNGGRYGRENGPSAGLAVARMLGHITYLSEEGMHAKFGRRRRDAPDEFGFGVHFEIESYLSYQGQSFVNRFDANSYLYVTRAMDYYDAGERWGGGDLKAACSRITSEVMVMSFSSDWLYTPAGCREFAYAIAANGRPVTYVDVPSAYGHDAFLVEHEQVSRLLAAFLRGGP